MEKENTCIVAGPPGIGKTTLAQMLLLYYQGKGYEPIAVSDDIKEAESVFSKDRKQIFYYDDFLGQTADFEKLGKNEDSRLLQFMRRVKSAPGKRLILTTREYIFQGAQQRDEKFDRFDFQLTKCSICLEDYTRVQRAKILYNHLYFSGHSEAALASVLDDSGYTAIINHPNYNPRLIADIVRIVPSREANDKKFQQAMLAVLNSPHEIWQHIFDHQLRLEGSSFTALRSG